MSGIFPSYKNMKELAGNSTAIITGETVGIKQVFMSGIPEIPMTDYNFKVDRVIRGDLKPGDVITIRQTGAESNDKIVLLEGDPLLKQGDKIVGFVEYVPGYDVYLIIGGPQGRFNIQNGMVYSMDNSIPEDAWIYVKARRQNLDDFVGSIEVASK